MQVDLFTGETIVDKAIARLKEFEPPEGYYLAFSGGKDSQCIYHLAEMAGVRFDAHYHATTIDPPDIVRFIKRNYPNVIFERPKRSLIEESRKQKFPPTRLMRWCCRVLKETNPPGRTVMLGVRWEESNNRSSRQMVEICRTDTTIKYVSPIIDWTEEDVFMFLKSRGSVPDHWWRCFKAMDEARGGDWKGKTLEEMWEWWLNDIQGYKEDENQECFRLTDN